jgi:predicted metal-binding membrane protein
MIDDTAAPTLVARARHDPAVALWAVAGACWVLLVGLALLAPDLAHHHGVVGATATGDRPAALVLGIFATAWLVMVAAMMLPSTVPMVRLHTVVTARVERRFRVRTAFLTAYFAVWLTFAGVALLGDVGVHALVQGSEWLRTRDGLVLAGTLGLAGAVQFTPVTRRCLAACRDPRGFLFQHYRRGVAAAWWLGARHGVFCLGCCWALMLVMFATGVADLWWMVALTAVMVAEKTTRRGQRLVAPVGVVLLFAAAWVGLDAVGAAGSGPPGHAH